LIHRRDGRGECSGPPQPALRETWRICEDLDALKIANAVIVRAAAEKIYQSLIETPSSLKPIM
jgi:hypothetical protein